MNGMILMEMEWRLGDPGFIINMKEPKDRNREFFIIIWPYQDGSVKGMERSAVVNERKEKNHEPQAPRSFQRLQTISSSKIYFLCSN